MFKEQLMSALKKAVDLHNTGLGDTEAVIKSANDAGFNGEQARRLTEVYNTTKTICFFKTAEDRTVSFTTADSDKVQKGLFCDRPADPKPKTASSFIPDYSCYDERVKSAEAEGEIVPLRKKEYLDKSLDTILREGDRIIRSEKQSADYCEGVAGQLLTKYCMTLDNAAADIRKNWHYGGSKQADAYNYIYATLGDRADALYGDLKARLPELQFVKSAELSDFDTMAPMTAAMLDEAARLKLDWAELKACAGEFRKMAEADEAELLKASEMTPPEEQEDFFAEGLRARVKSAAGTTYEVPSMEDRMKGTPEKERKTKKVEKFDPLGTVFSMGAQGVGEGTKKQLATGIERSFAGPRERADKKTTDKLRNFQRQIMLEELMYTDPILSNMEPQRVAQAYETVARLAPEVSLNKEVVRAILRASTNAEAVSTYDAKQLAELENEIRKQTTLQPGQAMPPKY